MMANKFSVHPSNILIDKVEPMSEEERERLAEEWVSLQLDRIFYLSIGNKNIKRAICETAGAIAKGDDELSEFIRDRLKYSKANRPKEWSAARMKNLLIHYALAVASKNGDKNMAIEWLCEYQKRASGVLLDHKSMNNLISKFIKETQIYSFKLPTNLRC